jgi:hypothetical protein
MTGTQEEELEAMFPYLFSVWHSGVSKGCHGLDPEVKPVRKKAKTVAVSPQRERRSAIRSRSR